MKTWWIVLLALMMTIVACEAEATPFPIEIPPTQTPPPPRTTPVPTIYGIAAESTTLFDEYQALGISADNLVQFTETETTLTDIRITYGQITDWQLVTPQRTIALLISPQITPDIADILRETINAQNIVTTLNIAGSQPLAPAAPVTVSMRTRLANIGYPDGISVVIGHASIPSITLIEAQLNTANITSNLQPLTIDDTLSRLNSGALQLGIHFWTTPEERQSWVAALGDTNVIDLFTLPLSYTANADITVTISPSGLPIATR